MGHVLTLTLNPAMDKTLILPAFRPGSVNRVREVLTDPGGKGINVARALKEWGESPRACGWIGARGRQGEALLDRLGEWGIPLDFVDVAGETRTNTKIVDRESGAVTDLNEPGFAVDAGDVERLLKGYGRLLDGASIVVLAGSLPPGAPPDLYAELTARAERRGVKVFLDAGGDALRHGMKSVPHAVKPNREELEAALGRRLTDENDIAAAGRELLRRGIRLAVVSMGAEGAWFFTDSRILRTRPAPVAAVNPVGAGDAMVAGLVMGEARGWSLIDTARFATAAGSQAASKPGTGFGKPEEIHPLTEQVRIFEWAGN